jgi:ATP-dependent exoDNAse (exonuclease V) beta subunit
LLPGFTTLFDIAREITGTKTGEMIRFVDFNYLLNQYPGSDLPVKFTSKYSKSYKRHLFEFVNEVSLLQGEFRQLSDEQPLLAKHLASIGLTSGVYNQIISYIREKGFILKGDILKKAIGIIRENKAIIKGQLLSNYRFCFTGFRYYSGMESELISLLHPLVFEDPSDQDISIGFKGIVLNRVSRQNILFMSASSYREQLLLIKHSIDKEIRQNPHLALSDFTVVCGGSASLEKTSAYFYARKIPFYSGVRYSQSSELTVMLQTILAASENDPEKITDYFNRHFITDTDNIIKIDLHNSVDYYTINRLYADLKSGNDHIIEKFSRKADLKKKYFRFLEILSSGISDKEDSFQNHLSLLNEKISALTGILHSDSKSLKPLDSYFNILSKIFSNRIKLSEIIDYLLEIVLQNDSLKSGDETAGIHLITPDDSISESGKIVYFIDLEEGSFLTRNNTNKLLNNDSAVLFDKLMFGKSIENVYLERLACFLKADPDKLFFVLPLYSEETIISSYIEDLLSGFPKQRKQLQLISKDGINILGDFDFSFTSSNLLSDNEELLLNNHLNIYADTEKNPDQKLEITYKNSNILNELKSATKLENFGKCPALFVHKLNCEYPNIETDDTFRPGKNFHSIVEDFILKYSGIDLLDEESFNEAFKNFGIKNGNLQEGDVDDFVHALVEEPNKATEISQLLADILSSSGVIEAIDRYLASEAELDRSRETVLIKTKIQLLRFMVKFIHYLGVTDSSVTSTFNIELAFGEMPMDINGAYHSVRGVIDFLYISKDNTLRIIDFKSSDLKEYADQMQKYQISQLLLYRQLLETAKQNAANYRFFEIQSDSSYGRAVQKLNPEIYKRILETNSGIEACYLSYKDKFKQDVDQSYDDFLIKLNQRLGDFKTFYPEANSNCKYCQLAQACHENIDLSIDLTPFEGVFKHNEKPFPVAEFQKTTNFAIPDNSETDKNSIHRLIQFDGDKATALVEDQKHIIISAGAGAGKTEVLAHKYLSLIINSGLVPENILCITFTNKAVGEMKKRIFSRLTETIDTGIFAAIPRPDAKDLQLDPAGIERLDLIKKTFHTSNRILTFHAFCNKLFEEHAKSDPAFTDYDLEYRIAPSYIINEEIRLYIRNQYIDGFKSAFINENTLTENEKEIFRRWHSSIQFYYSADFGEGGFVKEVQSIIDKINLSGKTYRQLLDMSFEEFSTLFEEIKNLSMLRMEYLLMKTELINSIEFLINNEADQSKKTQFEDALGQVQKDMPYSFGQTFRKYEEVRNLRDQIGKNPYYRFISKRSAQGFGENDFLDTEFALRKAFLMVAMDVNNHIIKFKKENGYIEQGDLHQIAIKLLESNPGLPSNTNTKYLLIDEFQDTNWLQDKIIEYYISNGSRIFIVGDMKQSIYRFQQCDNQIFKKYSLLSQKNPEKFIYLNFNENYRSVPQLVYFSNSYFSNRTTNPQFDIFGITSRDTEKPELMLPAKAADNQPPLISIVQVGYKKAQFEGLPESDLKQIVRIKEAEIIAQTILANDPHLTDLDRWGILIRKYSRIGYLIEVFKKYRIPYSFIMKSGLMDQPEVIDLILILKIVANLLKAEDIPYIENLNSLIEDVKTDPVCEKNILHTLEKIISHPVLHEHFRKDVNYLEKTANLDIIYKEICNSIEFTGTNLLNLIEHIENSAKSLGMEFFKNNSVKIMTIHSSKGLEFENVILANLNANDRNDHEQISFLNKVVDAGKRLTDISLNGIKDLYTDEYHPEFLKHMLINKDFNREFSRIENANLLYVALTRARKNIFITVQRNNVDTAGTNEATNWLRNSEDQLFSTQLPMGNFGTVSYNYAGSIPVKASRLNIDEIHPVQPEDVSAGKEINIKTEVSPKFLLTKKLQHPIVNVTAMVEGEDHPGQLAQISTEEARLTGNYVHKFLELHVPAIFERMADYDPLFDEFCSKYAFPVSEEMKKNVRDMIRSALQNEQFRHLFISSSTVFREQEFLFERRGGHDLFSQESTFIDGTVDLLIIQGNKAIIVDYKTGEIHDQYTEQLSLYSEAVKSGFSGISFTQKYIFRIGKDERGCELIEVKG